MLLNRKRFENKSSNKIYLISGVGKLESFCLTKQEEKAFYLLILSKNRLNESILH